VVRHTAMLRVLRLLFVCGQCYCQLIRVCVSLSVIGRARSIEWKHSREAVADRSSGPTAIAQPTHTHARSKEEVVGHPSCVRHSRVNSPAPPAPLRAESWREASAAGTKNAKSRHISSPFSMVPRRPRSRMRRE
jgi:hypothetical protein